MPERTVRPYTVDRPDADASLTPLLLGAYTHLRNPESVLVTDWWRIDDHRFALRVKWPSGPAHLPYDPRILTQTIRQSGLVVAHAECNVPLEHHTVLHRLDIVISPGFRPPARRAVALDVEVVVRRTEGKRSTGSLRMGINLLQDGSPVVRADSEFGWISPRAYGRLRGEHLTVDWGNWPLPAPVAPELVARDAEADVALAPTALPHRWQLRTDVSHRLLFDHPVDHVPGLVLMEAADQAARAMLAPTSFLPTRVGTTFARYVEFDQPCWIEAARVPTTDPRRLAARVVGTQDGEHAFSVDFEGVAP
ncbi:ScbA/BarX family gamma-butyrolactone biosynthesis protein [Streptomyces sp. TRM70350]|uniref:ScbA/BarX family gamma-butyrolactone biosynthesis protein n=1 Tax=Streptomyces sp. TRM70350 TaxID=2856165 RepID=UPI001C4595E0|nr:ScbA/BarX family gamma-butyrolactone biosynthesis protein [Streptomyces sp. TRM70350]MBV7699683.1 A-factor biosynthesis protein [Streptomyces sp. TRM70350]